MITIIHDKTRYEIEKEKILYILEKLTDKKVDEKDIRKLMRKYKLYDEYFLSNVNKLW